MSYTKIQVKVQPKFTELHMLLLQQSPQQIQHLMKMTLSTIPKMKRMPPAMRKLGI